MELREEYIGDVIQVHAKVAVDLNGDTSRNVLYERID